MPIDRTRPQGAGTTRANDHLVQVWVPAHIAAALEELGRKRGLRRSAFARVKFIEIVEAARLAGELGDVTAKGRTKR